MTIIKPSSLRLALSIIVAAFSVALSPAQELNPEPLSPQTGILERSEAWDGGARFTGSSTIIVVKPPIHVGVLASRVSAEQADFFRAHLEEQTDLPVRITFFRDADDVMEALERLDYTYLSFSQYLAGQRSCDCLLPLLTPQSDEGATSFRSALITSVNSGIVDISGLEGRRMAVLEGASFPMRFIPIALLNLSGAGFPADVELLEAGDAEATLNALMAGEVDVMPVWTVRDSLWGAEVDGTLTRARHLGRELETSIRVIWLSEPIPFGVHAVSRDLEAEKAARLGNAIRSFFARYPELETVFNGGNEGGVATAHSAMFEFWEAFVGNVSDKGRGLGSE